jgi:eukaryotic-like serine/threonine-protein kinase
MPNRPPAALADALRDRYVLEREIARGGMATVWLARDVKHDREVAVKVFRRKRSAAVGAERFLHEVRIIAQLDHPHILTLIDSGMSSNFLWYVIPYVRGESLRERLWDKSRLEVEEALAITRQIASAIDYAHRHGVIHRDIKPENVLLFEGEAMLADFGIALAVQEAGDKRLTQTGVFLGTPAYMSPEQARGERHLNGRSDIYSLAAVLYEMLAGQPPHTGATEQEVLANLIAEQPIRLRALRDTVPPEVDAAVARGLAKYPGDRFASGEEFVSALSSPHSADQLPSALASSAGQMPYRAAEPTTRWLRARLPIVLGVVLLLGMGGVFAWHRSRSRVPDIGKRIAVLPFVNLSQAEDEYFADGITDDVRGKLAALPGIQVIARSSSSQYAQTTKRPQEIGRELHVEYLLTGTVRWEKGPGEPSRVRVSPELVQAATGSTRWQEPFDAPLTDVFQVQADIAERVASALDVALGDDARHGLAAKPTESLAAYDAYLKGEAASQGMAVTDPAGLRRAITFYQHAVALDSGFIPAWAQLARAQVALYRYGAPIPEVAAQAGAAANRAKALRPDRPEGYVALGDYYRSVPGDNRRSLAAFEAGLELAPTNVDLLGGAGLEEQALGRWEASLQHLRRAAELDPRSALSAQRTAITLLLLRRFPEAQAEAERGLALAPTNIAMTFLRTLVAIGQGDLAGAQAVVRAALPRVDPDALLAFFGTIEDLYWVLDDAQQRRLLTLPPSVYDGDRGTWAIVRAQTYWLRGDTAKARVYGDSAQLVFADQLRVAPGDARHVQRGLALAYLGRKAEAIQEGKRGVTLWPVSRDANIGAYQQHQLVRIYLLVGEPEKALDQLEPLLRIPSFLTPGRLRIDPNFAPLRGNARFERLVGGR